MRCRLFENRVLRIPLELNLLWIRQLEVTKGQN
jgi:hypothetical protein